MNIIKTLLNLFNITSFSSSDSTHPNSDESKNPEPSQPPRSDSSESSNPDPSVLYPNLSENLMNYGLPGIYRITCLINKKVYIGESNNVLSRARSHVDSLNKNQNEVFEMQKDYNSFGRNSFTFHILFSGLEWENETKRREKEKEKEILLSYKPEQVYNLHPTSELVESKNFRIVCEINGVQYESVSRAAKQTKEKDQIIRMKLNNKHPGYIVIKKVVQGYTPVIIDDQEYPSIQAVVKANLAKDRFEVMRRLKSPKWEKWYYKYGKRKSGPEEIL